MTIKDIFICCICVIIIALSIFVNYVSQEIWIKNVSYLTNIFAVCVIFLEIGYFRKNKGSKDAVKIAWLLALMVFFAMFMPYVVFNYDNKDIIMEILPVNGNIAGMLGEYTVHLLFAFIPAFLFVYAIGYPHGKIGFVISWFVLICSIGIISFICYSTYVVERNKEYSIEEQEKIYSDLTTLIGDLENFYENNKLLSSDIKYMTFVDVRKVNSAFWIDRKKCVGFTLRDTSLDKTPAHIKFILDKRDECKTILNNQNISKIINQTIGGKGFDFEIKNAVALDYSYLLDLEINDSNL